MEYSISEVSKNMSLSISTLRYYDSLGLLPDLKKNHSGNRVFTDEHIEVIRVIKYLKKSGMQLNEIRRFMSWCKQGDSTLEKRLNLFKKQKEKVLNQINELNETLSLIEFKEWYYSKAIEDGTEKNIRKMPLEKMPKNIQEEFKKCHC